MDVEQAISYPMRCGLAISNIAGGTEVFLTRETIWVGVCPRYKGGFLLGYSFLRSLSLFVLSHELLCVSFGVIKNMKLFVTVDFSRQQSSYVCSRSCGQPLWKKRCAVCAFTERLTPLDMAYHG